MLESIMKKASLFWKVYFWILLPLALLGAIVSITEFSRWKGGNWSGQVEDSLLILGLYSYIFAKKLFPANFWKIAFGLLIGVWLLDAIYFNIHLNEVSQFLSFRARTDNPSPIEQVIGLALSLPMVYAIYQIGFKGKYLKAAQDAKVLEDKKEFRKINVVWLIILTIITLGLYPPLWFLKQREAINNLHSPEKLNRNTFIIIFWLSVISLIASFMPDILKAIGYISNTSDIEFLFKLLNLVPLVVLLFQIFKVRRILIDHLNDYLKKDIWVSGLFSFIFYIYYFQYLINQHLVSKHSED